MAIRITIPGIMRLVFFRTPKEVLAINDSSMVQRSLSGRGGLFQRTTAEKLAVFRTPDGDTWPAFRDQLDPLRAKHQRELEAALADIPSLLARLTPEIAALATYVCSGRAHRPPEVIVQQMVGRLFFPDYTASEESYDAAHTLQTWLSGGPVKTYLLKHSGALQGALDQIMGSRAAIRHARTQPRWRCTTSSGRSSSCVSSRARATISRSSIRRMRLQALCVRQSGSSVRLATAAGSAISVCTHAPW